jgi:hypothetical protein
MGTIEDDGDGGFRYTRLHLVNAANMSFMAKTFSGLIPDNARIQPSRKEIGNENERDE